AAFQKDREFYRRGFADPTTQGTEFFYSATAYAPPAPALPGLPPANRPAQATVDAIFNQAPPGSIATGNFFLNDDGTVYTGGADFGTAVAAGAYRYNGPFNVDGVAFRKIDDQGFIQQNQLDNYISIPLERYSIFGKGRFDLGEHVTAFAQATFAESRTDTLLQFSPASNGWSALIPHGTTVFAPSLAPDGVTTQPAYLAGGLYGLNCPATGGCTNSQAFPTPPELTQLLDSRPNPNDTWQLNRVLDFLGPRSTTNVNDTYQALLGLQGTFPNNDWTWELYASHGATNGDTSFNGFGSLERYRALVTSPNYGRGFFQTGNGGPPGVGFGGGTGRCTSGLPIFGGTISQDCIDAVNANLQNTQRMEQNVAEFNLQGKAASMPAGDLRFAVGADYRDNSYDFNTDILTSQQSFLDSGIGLFPAGSSDGKTEVKEAYGELLVPLLSGKKLVDQLNLELGYRRSDNDPGGGVNTYKALFDWQVGDRIRLRGGRQIANRAPNIAELFQSRTQTLNTSFIGDFCSTANAFAPFGANPAVNPNAAQARAICEARMGPTGAAVYYSGTQTPGGFSFSFENLVGNPNLDIETAETYTLGTVFSLKNRTSLSVDWYQISISDLIAAQSADNVYSQCLSPATNPTFDPNAPACLLIQRDPATGFIAPTDVTYSNEGAVKTTGVDVQLNWGTDLGNGGLNLNFFLNRLVHYETQLNPTSPFLDWVGTFGPTLTSLNGGSYKWRTFTTLSYYTGPWNVSLRWQHLPKIESANAVTSPATNFTAATDAYDIFNLSGGWQFGDKYTLRFGVDNLFDKEPPVTGRDIRTTPPDSNTGNGMTNASFYDVLGRRAYIGLNVSF
ncbi:MAG TPA: TonB-dependent receptor, partial [Gammaproteobacteria bacterium]|nr:TonB-dependent receptor [Gammaproteobacteria bacterium]